MAWTENDTLRTRRSRTYEQGAERRWSGTLATLHYEGTLDSGFYDAAVDATPVRVDVAALDGWRVQASGWHYALGQPAGKSDGWVGFGGRQGAHWFQFKLLSVGYLHWPTRSWDDVGGAPDYDRANLSQETRSLSIGPNEDAIAVESVATWASIWTTPGGGALDVSWKVRGDQLKEEIRINQVAREWIAANEPPATPAAETWFGFVFDLDWSDIPRVYRDQALQDPDADDFADDGQGIELRDASDRLLAFMPLDTVTVPGTSRDAPHVAALRKRFYKDGANYRLLVGVRCDTLAGLAAGDLLFDPTVNEQVGANADDGYADDSSPHGSDSGEDTWYESGWSDENYAGASRTALDKHFEAGARFQSVNVPNGASVSVADFQVYAQGSNGTLSDVHLRVYGDDVDDAPAWSSSDMPHEITGTTAYVDVDPSSWASGDWESFPDVSAIVEEIVGRGSWAANNDLRLAVQDDGSVHPASGENTITWTDYNGSSSNAPKLDITYSTAGVTVPTLYYHYAHH